MVAGGSQALLPIHLLSLPASRRREQPHIHAGEANWQHRVFPTADKAASHPRAWNQIADNRIGRVVSGSYHLSFMKRCFDLDSSSSFPKLLLRPLAMMIEVSLADVGVENCFITVAFLFGKAFNFSGHFPLFKTIPESATQWKFRKFLH